LGAAFASGVAEVADNPAVFTACALLTALLIVPFVKVITRARVGKAATA
jgi:hypothetical protein